MAGMTLAEIRAMSDEEIMDAIEDKKAALFAFRRDRVTGELKDTNVPTYARRDVARMKTILRERELAEMARKEGNHGE
jgi:large subunit ribosomal protein L29